MVEAHFLSLSKQLQMKEFFSQDLEGTYVSVTAPSERGFLTVLFNFLGINTHNFAKHHSNLKNKGLFHAEFDRV